MKSLRTLLLLACCWLTAASLYAQSASSVLDSAAEVVRRSGTIHAGFTVTQFSGTTPSSAADGELWMAGERFKMATPDFTTWCDGKTLWSMMEGSGEVNLIEPDDSDLMTTSPYHFVNAYKKGYRLSMKKGTLRGQQVYTVTLKARDKKAQPGTVVLDIAQADYTLLCIRLKAGNDWTRVALTSLQTNVTVDPSLFSFDPAQHPGVEVIDLR